MKTLILAVDVGDTKHDWVVRAMQMQIRDYFKANKSVLKTENVIIFPVKGEMKLYWLEGNPDSVEDIEELEEIKDRIKPVLEVAMGINIKKNKKVKKPRGRSNK